MKKTIAFYLAACLLLLNICGCAPVLIGAAVGGVGIYAVGKDTIQGDTDKPYDNIWQAALTISRIRGTIKQEDSAGGYIELQADSSRIWVRVMRLTRSTVRIKVSARRYHLPNLDLAQEIFTKIIGEASR